jgi:UDP-MurNAc hydroxylase
MKVKLISHASVVIKSQNCHIWTDPWLFGTAFNNSWAQYPAPQINESDYESINYIWISHEHPDHFHIPTLKSLKNSFKSKVTILYQKNNSEKLFETLKKLGFTNFVILPHRRKVKLADNTTVYCYQCGTMDSVLGVMENNELILNINDAELHRSDCSTIVSDLETSPDVVLNQFSIAGYSGHENRDERLSIQAQQVLDNCSANHIDLGAKVTIPFASFVYFCKDDNFYVNSYINTPADFASYMRKRTLDYAILYLGDEYDLDYSSEYDSSVAEQNYIEAYDSLESQAHAYTEVPKSFEEIVHAFNKRYSQVQKDYYSVFRKFLKPVSVYIPDLDKRIVFSFFDGNFSVVDNTIECDLTVNSQPLWFAFNFPFGVQTLGVSARYILHKNENNWKKHRVLFSMNNAEIYLSHRLLTKSNFSWIIKRFPGLLSQILYRTKIM